jgi:alpha-N-arabinofuranosidase
VTTPDYTLGDTSVPAVHATAARDKGGALHIALSNLDPHKAADVSIEVTGGSLAKLTGQLLTATRMDTINTFEAPNAIRPVAFSQIKIRGEQVQLTLPAMSVLVLSQ